MKPPSEGQRQALMAELDLHVTEFQALRSEILHWLDADRQYLNFTLIAIAAGLGLIPFLIAQKVLIVLLFFPLIFHVLLYEMLNAVTTVTDLSIYLVGKLIPRVNAILDQLGDDQREISALGWEVASATKPLHVRDVLSISLTPTRHWIPILAIAAFLVLYIVLGENNGYTLTTGALLLVLLNLVFLVWAGIRNTLVARRTVRTTNELRHLYPMTKNNSEAQGNKSDPPSPR